jgi:hypothetical protein
MVERRITCLAEAPGKGRRLRIVVTAAMAASLLLPLDLHAARSITLPLFSLRAPLTVAPDLPAVSKRLLISEAERIWKREGVALEWPTGPADVSASLRVLVIARREAVMRGSERWPVAELVPQTDQRALAIASIASAERVLDEASAGRQLLVPPESTEYRLGVVLGRAVAHEIGHYLLATATHAEHGLMRAAIDAHEFADPAARTFGLDGTAGDWLRRHLRTASADAASRSPFRYTQH